MHLAAAHQPQPPREPVAGAALALVALVTLLFLTGAVPLPNLDGALESVSRTLRRWADLAVAGFAILETGAFVGLLVPARLRSAGVRRRGAQAGTEEGESRGRAGGGEGDRQPAVPELHAEAEPAHQRSPDPPGGEHALIFVVNARASGVGDPRALGRDLIALAQELGAAADAVVTHSEEGLWEALRFGARLHRRVVLVGGDGSLHAAANAPVRVLPELALVPTGRANNVARALRIPSGRSGAVAAAIRAPARPLDVLAVGTPDRFVYAVEALSAGFQAHARSEYRADNSADLRQGVRALLRALRGYRPYRVALRLERGELRSDSAAQLFLSNLPFFGFGFEVDPGADPSDGRFEAILLEARHRRRLVRLLAAVRHGRHLGKRGVRRVPARRAQLTQPLPLVADALPLGTTTATVSVESARLRVASPSRKHSARPSARGSVSGKHSARPSARGRGIPEAAA